jgi:hypothetical protein
LALADLFLLIGRPGAPGSKLYPIAEKANTRGVCELGVLPDRLPGYQPLNAEKASDFFGGKSPVPEAGPTLLEALDRLEQNDPAAPKALYALGGDLLRWLPNRSRTEKLLKKLRSWWCRTPSSPTPPNWPTWSCRWRCTPSRKAPSSAAPGSWALVNQALSANGVRPDWQIISQFPPKMGFRLELSAPRPTFFRNWRASCPYGPGWPPSWPYRAPR